jgi:hypothetical protein
MPKTDGRNIFALHPFTNCAILIVQVFAVDSVHDDALVERPVVAIVQKRKFNTQSIQSAFTPRLEPRQDSFGSCISRSRSPSSSFPRPFCTPLQRPDCPTLRRPSCHPIDSKYPLVSVLQCSNNQTALPAPAPMRRETDYPI